MSGRPQPPKPPQRGRTDAGSKSDGPSPLTLIGSGFEFAGAVALLTLGGWWLDGRLGSRPWLMLLGLLVGTVGGIYRLYLEGKRFFRD